MSNYILTEEETSQISSEIKRRSAALGWSQSRLAREAKLSQQHISRLLNGDRKRLSSATAQRIQLAIAPMHRLEEVRDRVKICPQCKALILLENEEDHADWHSGHEIKT